MASPSPIPPSAPSPSPFSLIFSLLLLPFLYIETCGFSLAAIAVGDPSYSITPSTPQYPSYFQIYNNHSFLYPYNLRPQLISHRCSENINLCRTLKILGDLTPNQSAFLYKTVQSCQSSPWKSQLLRSQAPTPTLMVSSKSRAEIKYSLPPPRLCLSKSFWIIKHLMNVRIIKHLMNVRNDIDPWRCESQESNSVKVQIRNFHPLLSRLFCNRHSQWLLGQVRLTISSYFFCSSVSQLLISGKFNSGVFLYPRNFVNARQILSSLSPPFFLLNILKNPFMALSSVGDLLLNRDPEYIVIGDKHLSALIGGANKLVQSIVWWFQSANFLVEFHFFGSVCGTWFAACCVPGVALRSNCYNSGTGVCFLVTRLVLFWFILDNLYLGYTSSKLNLALLMFFRKILYILGSLVAGDNSCFLMFSGKVWSVIFFLEDGSYCFLMDIHINKW